MKTNRIMFNDPLLVYLLKRQERLDEGDMESDPKDKILYLRDVIWYFIIQIQLDIRLVRYMFNICVVRLFGLI